MQGRPSRSGIYAANPEFEQRWAMVLKVLNWLNSSWIDDKTKEAMVELALNVIASSKPDFHNGLLQKAAHKTMADGHVTKLFYYSGAFVRFENDYRNIQSSINSVDDLTRQIQTVLGNDYINRGLQNELFNPRPTATGGF